MNKMFFAKLAVACALVLTVAYCSQGTFYGNGDNSLFSLVCNPFGAVDETSASNIPSMVTFFDNNGDATSNQGITIDFGTAVTSAINVADSGTLNIAGDSVTTDANGEVNVLLNCSSLGTTGTPCSITYTNGSSSCGASFF